MVELFKEEHLPEINSWLSRRDMGRIYLRDLPSIGYIENDIAAGFLVETNCTTAVLDFFFSNPKASKEERSNSILEIADALIEAAQLYGFKRVKFQSKIESVINIGEKIGFEETGTFRSFVKEISHG